MNPARNSRSALAAAIAFALGVTHAHAATIAVGSGDDIFHSTTCNLRNALASLRLGAAQGACAPAGNFGDNDTVTFAPALANSTITLARGELTIAGSITIAGSGQTIDANYASRVIYLNHASLTASNLTLTHGYASGLGRDGNGAGLYAYASNATLDGVTISHNVALGDGAGMDVSGSLTMTHSTVSDNIAALATGGVSVYGTATIGDSLIIGNSGARTGGLAVFSGYSSGGGYGSTISSIVTVTHSTIGANSALCSSSPCTGGVYSSIGNFVSIREATISGNTASADADRVAGGVYAYDSVLTLVNATIASNSASGNAGVAGALWHTGTDYGQSRIDNTTIAANLASTRNGGANVRSGILLGYGSSGDSKLQVRNSIVAGNAGGTDLGVSGNTATMTSSVAGTIADIPRFNVDVSNHFTDTPGLGALQDNGGPTQTMALLAGSIAIDKGNNAFATSLYDQRGAPFARAVNGTIDIGAVEFQADRIFAYGFEAGP